MLIVQDQVWNRVTVNRALHKSTRYYIDEFHLLLKEEQTAAYSVEIWKRFRKWGGIPTGITQNIKDLLASREIENIFENSDFIYMLNQAAGDRQILAKQLNISPHQLSYVTNSGEGEGLIFYGSTIIPFKDKFDKSLRLYALMTTKPRIWKEQEKRREKQNVKNGYDYQWGLSGGAKSLPDESIHCCVTSPPYYALRDYGKENQIGREGAPEEYIGHLVSVFCELKRVLRSDGTFWLNIADCYSRKSYHGLSGCKPKELMGLPWLLALTLRKEAGFFAVILSGRRIIPCRRVQKTDRADVMNISSCLQSPGNIFTTILPLPSRLL